MLELKRIPATRIVATPMALDAANWPTDAIALRFAQDEVWITPPIDTPALDDPHAIIIRDGGFAGVWLEHDAAIHLLEHTCEWELPSERPAFAQGAVAGIPAKLWFEEDRVLFVIPAPFMAELEEVLS